MYFGHNYKQEKDKKQLKRVALVVLPCVLDWHATMLPFVLDCRATMHNGRGGENARAYEIGVELSQAYIEEGMHSRE